MTILMKEDEAQMISMFNEGYTVETIRDEMGWDRKTILKVLRVAGLAPIGQHSTLLEDFTVEKLQALTHDYSDLHLPVRAILEKYNLTDASVLYQLLHDAGIPVRKFSKATIDIRARQMKMAIGLYLDRPDLTIARICEETGIVQTELSKELRRQHAKPRCPAKIKGEI